MKLYIVATNDQDRTITVSVDGIRYEYWFHGEVPLRTVEKILRYSSGRAIEYLKRRSYKAVRLSNRHERHEQAKEAKVQEAPNQEV